jgi:spore germination protein
MLRGKENHANLESMKKWIAVCALVLAAIAGSALFAYASLTHRSIVSLFQRGTDVELSGWIAWWKEDEGYKTVNSRSGEFHTISPNWFVIDSSFSLKDVSTTKNKAQMVTDWSKRGLEVLPLINTDLTLGELSPLFDANHSSQAISQIIEKILALGAPGADIDIEEVQAADRDSFYQFLAVLHKEFALHHLKLAVSVIAQTGDLETDGEGTQGVDYARIGAVADQVNVLIYDLHGDGSESGPITTIGWLHDVVAYTLTQIPKEKIVVGLPMYGYKWELQSTDPTPYTYDEFVSSVGSDKKLTKERDAESAELHYTGPGQEAWLADAVSVRKYMDESMKLGLSRFSIWQIGGMDENLF